MNQVQKLKFDSRKKLMQSRKVVCTGNPDRPGTLASEIVKVFPDAIFLCRSTGWDLKLIDKTCKQKLKEIFSKCNTFLNCSFIAPGVQLTLLELCHESAKFCDVINIGSTHEYDNLGSNADYSLSKIDLCKKSLELNSFRFSTCHLILGGIKNDNSDHKVDWLDPSLIVETMIDIWHRPYSTPMMVMDQWKEPW